MSSGQLPLPGADASKTIRLVRPSVVVLCGPAACGKSTFAARHFRPTQIISSDHARALVSDDERDQRFQAQAFALVHCLIEQRLSINRLCVVDSTALTEQARKSLIELSRRYQVPVAVLVLDVPLETCLAYDQKRERVVGREVIERQHQLFQQAKAALKNEGFDQVIILGEKDLETAQIEVVFRPIPREAPAARRPEPGLPRAPRLDRAAPGNRAGFQTRRPPSPTRPPASRPPAATAPASRPEAPGPQPSSTPSPAPSSGPAGTQETQ